MELDLERCTVRSWRLDDMESLVRHANNRKVWRNLRDSFPHPYTLEDAEEWVTIAGAQDPEVNFAIAVDDVAVGGIGFELQTDVFRKSAEIGYWLGERFWGQGIMTEAVRAVTSFGFATLGFERIYAGVFSWNPGSARVLEKVGYEFEAKLRNAIYKEGHLLDEYIYATWPDRWQPDEVLVTPP
ncbi:GNAT family N-acetyltransferase [Persicimonas caeni]|uniref:GNAT family N-acetyltransferase n=1 Tax=Persicimonas caeni TaxID=2292766 RepID=A0A4Y6PZR2_PERCE|nr:GNAT family N-acetyltransferase [Persicimonas caeni]QDG53235.1 GNAT family N-acetyltransferase [Persicimonas caeni]QED34457.1 GNAT family N-acetyltransferase [Persicimonas caeni]